MNSIVTLLQREPEFGSQMQQLVVRPFKDDPTQEETAAFIKLWKALNSTAGRNLTQMEAKNRALESILIQCRNLQTLVLAGGILSFPLVAISQGKNLPLLFLAHSLKRLFLTTGVDPKLNMTAQIIVWVLTES